MKIISFSLWGNTPKYTVGAVRNAELVNKIYPGWTARFYCGATVPTEIVADLQRLKAEVVFRDDCSDNRGMFWRFLALSDPLASHIIFRDTDSRLNSREEAAVAEWIDSGKCGHIMRDHPLHPHLMLGGMWGCKGNIFTDIESRIVKFSPRDAYNQDQLFLAQVIYPELKRHGLIIHDSCTLMNVFVKKFPTPRNKQYNFVGEIIDENECRNDQWKDIVKFESSFENKFIFIFRLLRKIKLGIKQILIAHIPCLYKLYQKVKKPGTSAC